mgnify:CR=1 FL=1
MRLSRVRTGAGCPSGRIRPRGHPRGEEERHLLPGRPEARRGGVPLEVLAHVLRHRDGQGTALHDVLQVRPGKHAVVERVVVEEHHFLALDAAQGVRPAVRHAEHAEEKAEGPKERRLPGVRRSDDKEDLLLLPAVDHRVVHRTLESAVDAVACQNLLQAVVEVVRSGAHALGCSAVLEDLGAALLGPAFGRLRGGHLLELAEEAGVIRVHEEREEAWLLLGVQARGKGPEVLVGEHVVLEAHLIRTETDTTWLGI